MEPRNRAVEAVLGFVTMLESHERSLNEWDRWFADDFVREDRRQMIALPAADAAAFREQHLAWFEMGTEKLGIEITEVLAVSGQRLALTRALIGYSSGFPLEMLSVTQWNEGGDRLEKMFQFDGDDVDGALAELDRLRVAVDPQDDAR